MFCKNCGSPMDDGALFCPKCGTKQDDGRPEIAPQEQPGKKKKGKQKKEKQKKEKQKKEKKGRLFPKILLALIGVIVVVVAAFAAYTFLFAKADSLVYVVDNQTNVYSMKLHQHSALGDDIFAYDDDADALQNYFNDTFQTSDDGRYLFYPQDYSNGSFSLYRKKLGSEDAEEIEIDSDVTDYAVLSGHKIIYLKGSDTCKLYCYDKDDKRKIASDVAWFRISADQKYVLWYSNDGNNKLYVQDIAGKKDRIKIDGDIDWICAYSDNFDKIVYEKEDCLYVMRNFEEKEQVASDVDDVSVSDINGDFGIYYQQDSGDTVDLYSAVIEDGYAESDANMKEPVITDYQKKEMKDSFWGLRESITTDDSYYDDYDKYQEKLNRDDIRYSLQNGLVVDSSSLYYYSDASGESKLLLEGYMDNQYAGNDILVISSLESDAVGKVSMDDLMDADDEEMGDALEKAIVAGFKMCVFNGTKEIDLSMDFEKYDDDLYECMSDSESQKLYFLLENTEDQENDLFEADYGQGNGELELIAEDVDNIELVNSDGVYYISDCDDMEGTLYLNGSRVDDDVRLYTVYSLSDHVILYMTDVDEDSYAYVGTLKRAEQTDKTTVADDVVLYAAKDEDEIAVLVDYNVKKYRGDLKLYKYNELIKNGKLTSVDTDVSTIVGFY